MRCCNNCMYSGWVKDSELLRCHNSLSDTHKTENSKRAICPEWVVSDDIENDVNYVGVNITMASSI